jgi:hypothetical protein
MLNSKLSSRLPSRHISLLFFPLTLLLLFFWWWQGQSTNNINVIAKGTYTSVANAANLSQDETVARNIVLADQVLSQVLNNKESDFLSAVPLGEGEAESWQEAGCGRGNCFHVLFYNYSDGGTLEMIVNRDRSRVVASWQDLTARPGASRLIIPKAVRIAAADKEVQTILGDIATIEMVMAPMGAWLKDDDCNRDWCVDLTFAAPDGSGKIVHVFINMQQQKVARVFSTRSRPTNQLYNTQDPVGTGNLFDDGCHQEYGWDVCWETTAHDGVNFYGATFNEEPVFSSVKIAQVEVWYPAWPGGYRDEIGYASSVPPKFGTTVRSLENGFEVHQLFTEPFNWPNCICCYRYEQTIRFYDDGSFEPSFISQGPGCDDLSIYRPFWRIDLDGVSEDDDQLWEWDGDGWVEVDRETEVSLFTPLSLEQSRLAVSNGEQFYEWRPIPTDPLQLDDGLLFALKWNQGEGDDPILPGSADTFEPPRQWINGETLTDQNIVFWYIPFLKTKKGGIWWCMPEPAPDFTPCEAILHISPTTELHQPTAEEMAQLTPTATPTPEPAESPTPVATSTPGPIAGVEAIEIIHNAGCGSCHLIGDLGESRKVGPDLSNIGLTASERVAGLSAEAYIRQSILEPNAFLVEDCPNSDCLANAMPDYYTERLTQAQVDTLVAFLLTQKVEDAAATPEPIGDGDEAAGNDGDNSFEEPSSSGGSALLLAGLAVVMGLGAAAIWFRRNRRTTPTE